MTNGQNGNGDRLDRIEAIVESLARSAQAINNDHEERIQTLKDLVARLTCLEEGQNRMLASIDDDRPTILRRLMTIENKVDRILERE
ncbi:hypothetical protein IQ255_06015 [Pleurocapsales cyanobacterium LEGE 10410]|nr:hypothetical protein [Pleurocapsales cyanobacterium LEGE 10410]